MWTDLHAPDDPGQSLDDLDAVVGSLRIRPLGSVIASDSFADPDAGLLPTVSPQPGQFYVGYRNSEYQIHATDTSWNRTTEVLLKGVYSHATIAVDVRLLSDDAGQTVEVGCRRPDTESSGYRLLVEPATGRAVLMRIDAGQDGARTICACPGHHISREPMTK